MKAILTSAVLLLFALSTAVSAGAQAEKKTIKKTVKTEQKSGGAWLGVALGDITTSTDEEGGKSSTTTKGAVIEEVINDSPADSAGLKEEDVIVEINGKAVAKSEDVVKRIGDMKPGEKATIAVMRGDSKKTVTVALGSQPKMRHRMEMRGPGMGMNLPGGHPFGPMMMEHRPGVEGMKLMELTDQLGRYFEAPDGKALLVTEVKKNSNARKAGIEAGDVITKVGQTDIEDMGDLHQALRDAKEGSTVDVEIIRKGAHKSVKLEVSKQDEEMGMMHFEGNLPHMEDFRFNLDNFNFNREELRDIMRDLKPQLDKIKPELDRIKKEIRLRMRGQEVNAPSAPEAPEAPDTDL